MGPDQFLYFMSELAVELDRSSKENQGASQKALAEVSGVPEPGSLGECELSRVIRPNDVANSGVRNGESELHNLFDLASTLAEKADGTEIRSDHFDAIFDAVAANHLSNRGIEKVRKSGNATVISLVKPLIKGDGSGNSITFGEKISSEHGARSRYEFSLTPVFKNESIELLTKGVNADTLLGKIPVSSISLQPREGGNISFEIHTDFGSKRGCAFAGTGKEVLEQ